MGSVHLSQKNLKLEMIDSHLITRKLFGKPFGQELRQNTRESEELGQLASER